MQRNYSCAVVTGASSGLGEEFAWQLAPRVERLVLVARSVEKLEKTAEGIRAAQPGTEVMVLAADLSEATDRKMVAARIRESGLSPDLLINNAGLGDYGEFAGADWGVVKSMLEVNIVALTHLTHLLLPQMTGIGGGAILNVSSLAGCLPIPDFAVYAATKAYVSSFSEALRIELKEVGVDVTHLCPGPVKTSFGENARRGEGGAAMPPGHEYFYVPKKQVVEEALSGLDRRVARVFPGWKIAAAGLFLGAVPLAVLRLIMAGRPRR